MYYWVWGDQDKTCTNVNWQTSFCHLTQGICAYNLHTQGRNNARYKVLTVLLVKVKVCSDVTLCQLVNTFLCFKELNTIRWYKPIHRFKIFTNWYSITPHKTWIFRTRTVRSTFIQVSEIIKLTLSSEPMTTFPHGHYNSMKGHTFKNKDNSKKNWISMSLHQRNNFLHCMLIKKDPCHPQTLQQNGNSSQTKI